VFTQSSPGNSEKMGHSSVLARNGKEAVALAFDQKFDLARGIFLVNLDAVCFQ
jgi:hypothetical protein